MASQVELRPSEPDQRGECVRGDGAVRSVPDEGDGPSGADRGYAAAPARERREKALGGGLSVAHHALWNASEPERGQMVRARHAGHHTASLVFTRDDAEGHPPVFGDEQPRNWWSHDFQDWMSWQQVGELLSRKDEHFIVEMLIRPSYSALHRMCQPDGVCELEELGHDEWT